VNSVVADGIATPAEWRVDLRGFKTAGFTTLATSSSVFSLFSLQSPKF
jgi:hypothetical protein